jgi:hypothetical protein
MTLLRLSLLIESDLTADEAFKAFENSYKKGQKLVGYVRNKPVFGEVKRYTMFSANAKDKELAEQ